MYPNSVRGLMSLWFLVWHAGARWKIGRLVDGLIRLSGVMDSFDCHGYRTHSTESRAQPRTKEEWEERGREPASMPQALLLVAWLVRGFFSTCWENPLTLLNLVHFEDLASSPGKLLLRALSFLCLTRDCASLSLFFVVGRLAGHMWSKCFQVTSLLWC